MTKRFIEKEIKTESDNRTPNVFDRVVFTAQSQGLIKTTDKRTEKDNGVRRAKGFKALLSAAIAVVICLAIVLPITLRGGNTPTTIHLTNTDVYGIGAVSTAKLLGSRVSVNAIATLSASTKVMTAESSESSDVKDNIERFNQYFAALDSFLGEELVSTVTAENTNPNYPFTTVMTITGKDINGNNVPYTMYYSETLVNDESDEEESEKEFALTGIMVIDGIDYYLEGERTEESEKDEQENELRIRAYLDKDVKDSYIQMEQEVSQENNEKETEYVYSVYSDGKLVEQTSVEFETERNGTKEETEYELEFIQGSAKGRKKKKKETVNGQTQINVVYQLNGKQGEFTIKEVEIDGQLHYQYMFDDDSVQVI